ncbi:MAG: hypothetical protein IPO92_07180 [Saprospiraceae bacterium]|nr:hypothetical protein [Saprospiraceae bacterium]
MRHSNIVDSITGINHFCIGLLIILFCHNNFIQAQVTLNPTNNAVLMDIASTSKGVITPRMTFVQRNAIVNPAQGLLVFQVDSTKGYYFYVNSNWKNLSMLVLLSDVDNDTKVQVEKNNDENIIRMDLGGTEHMALKKNNVNEGRIEFSNNKGSIYMGKSAGKNSNARNFAIGDSTLVNIFSGANNLDIGKSVDVKCNRKR